MQLRCVYVVCVLLFTACGQTQSSSSEQSVIDRAQTVRGPNQLLIVADAWLPFNGDAESGPAGYMIDMAREIFAEHGIEVLYKNIPWKRALLGVQEGRYDAAVGASRTDGAGLVFPSLELASNRLAFFTRADDAWRFTGPASLEAVSLGVIAGYDYRSWLLAYIQKHKDDSARIQIISGDEPLVQNLKKLQAGRVRVVVDTEAAIRAAAKSVNLDTAIRLAGNGTEISNCYIAFSPKHPRAQEFAEMLSEGIKRMRESGRLQAILATYGLDDWKIEEASAASK